MVKSKKFGIVHAYAQCSDCDWDASVDISDKNRMNKLRNKIYSHVEETGHKVRLETSNSTHYYKTS